MALLEPARLVNQALEDASHRFGIQRGWTKLAEPLDEPCFPSRIVGGQPASQLVFGYLQDHADALRDESEELGIQIIDLASKGFELRLGCHGRHGTCPWPR